MLETWIRADAAELRRHRWRLTALTVVCVLLAVVFLVAPLNSGEPTPLSERLWALLGVGVFWMLMMVYLVNLLRGRTRLTVEGMRFHTLFSRRFVRWTDVTDIDVRTLTRPAGSWHDVRVRRSRGRRLIVPGVYTNKQFDKAFDEKLQTIRYYWSRGTRVRPDAA